MSLNFNFTKKNFFKNKVVLITGGNGQLGFDICKFYKDLDCKVYSLDNSHSNKINRLKNINKFTLDVTNKKECQRIINLINKKEKKIDILINNAGTSIFSHYSKRTEEELDYVYSVNLKGIINMILEVSKNHKKKNHLKILNIGSIYGVRVPNFKIYKKDDRLNSEIYGATKAGVIQVTKYFAKTLANMNILCNCVSPGGIKSNKTQKKSFQKRYIENLQIKRMATTDDIIFGLFYLSHPMNTYITGQNLIIDGGYSL